MLYLFVFSIAAQLPVLAIRMTTSQPTNQQLTKPTNFQTDNHHHRRRRPLTTLMGLVGGAVGRGGRAGPMGPALGAPPPPPPPTATPCRTLLSIILALETIARIVSESSLLTLLKQRGYSFLDTRISSNILTIPELCPILDTRYLRRKSSLYKLELPII